MILDVVVGAQYGSEAKGHVTQRLIDQQLANKPQPKIANVRVAGPNAGHTAHTLDGVAVPFRQLPVGALRPGVKCVIAAGSEVDPPVLLDEIDKAIRYGAFNPDSLAVDLEATVLTQSHQIAETGMHERMGSTGKGIGAARADRIMRKAWRVGDDENLTRRLADLGVHVIDTSEYLRRWPLDHIVVEGTQGYGLGLHAGHYPQCTSSDCRAIDFLGMAGISPWWFRDHHLRVWAVARVFPIRVAGNSGYLHRETTWEKLGLPEERTTVTKKVRRVGEWDQELVSAAVAANGGEPTVRLAITMLDQKFPEVKGMTQQDDVYSVDGVGEWLGQVGQASNADIQMVTTGPNTGIIWGEGI